MVPNSIWYKLTNDNQVVGYAIVNQEGTLIEFYLLEQFEAERMEYFDELVEELEIDAVLCQTYDSLLMEYCMANQWLYQLEGCLYRHFEDRGLAIDPKLTYRYAQHSDRDFLLDQEDDVFEPRDRLPYFIEQKGILLLYDADVILGCGFLTRVHPDFDYYDIGVWVHPQYRMQGLATQIMLKLKDICEKTGKIPQCACDIHNLGSQRMLAKIGFVSNEKLMLFSR